MPSATAIASSAAGEQRYERASIHGPLLALTFAADEVGGDRQFDAVIIREGVFQPGIGNPEGDRIWFGRDFLARLAPTGEGKKVDLDHSQRLEDEVGVMTQLRMDADGERLRATVVLQKTRPRFMDALGFIKGRLDAGLIPNVSIELTNLVLRPAQTPEEKAKFDLAVVDAKLEGLAILGEGACSDEAGCGIGLAAPKESHITVHALQGIDNKENHKTMCDQKAQLEVLQGKVTSLEADLNKEKQAVAALTSERNTLQAAADQREKQDIEDLTEAVKEALPKDADLADVIGETPTVASLTVALKALHAARPKQAPAAPAAKVGLGRHTAAVTRQGNGEPSATNADRDARVLALRKRYGLPEKTNLPPSMARNTAVMLAAVPDARPEAAAE